LHGRQTDLRTALASGITVGGIARTRAWRRRGYLDCLHKLIGAPFNAKIPHCTG
jgi:hypothetical protein